MNTRLRNSLGALVLAAGVTSLGYALGEPPRPGSLAANASQQAVAAIAQVDARAGQTTARAGARSPHAVPFFSFGKRASAGAP
ncbi:hypothetical protein [Silanimonas sp.]|jgi:hypothetical protein|uniref:hypothetical protein n=1 Tax=Silanimonas sp. TaxID=1929290 RepID=UPI0037C75647